MTLSSDVHCRVCDGTGIFLPKEFLHLENNIDEILSAFPLPDIMGKGQWFFKPSTIARFIAYMYQKHDIEGKTIGCLASPTIAVGLSLLREISKLNFSITVLDIDSDILGFLSSKFKSINTYEYNIENDCPIDISGTCDTFVFDPLYSIDHYRIGISRCVQLIGLNRTDRSGYIIIPPEEIAPIKTESNGKKVPLQLAVFGFLNEMGLCIADYKDNFIEYSTPLSEEKILLKRSVSFGVQSKLDGWRGSDLVRVVSTAETVPLVENKTILEKRVNLNPRTGKEKNFIQLEELSISETCSVCSRCFTSYIDDQKLKKYTSYWKPEVITRTMNSWRAEGDQPYEIARSCTGFENTKNGDLTILRGPASREIWATIRDLEEELGISLPLNLILKRALPDFSELDQVKIRHEAKYFIIELMEIGLIKEREIVDEE